MAQNWVWPLPFLAFIKIWAPPPSLSTLVVVDQEEGGAFFCPSSTDQPVETKGECFDQFTVKK